MIPVFVLLSVAVLLVILVIFCACHDAKKNKESHRKTAEIKARLALQTDKVEDIENLLKWYAEHLPEDMIDQLIDRAGELRSLQRWDNKYARIAAPESEDPETQKEKLNAKTT